MLFVLMNIKLTNSVSKNILNSLLDILCVSICRYFFVFKKYLICFVRPIRL